MIVAELVANVVRHGHGTASFSLDWRERHPKLMVVDGGPGFHENPRTELDDPYAECGRGLALVRSLALSMELGNGAEGGGFVTVTLPIERSSQR